LGGWDRTEKVFGTVWKRTRVVFKNSSGGEIGGGAGPGDKPTGGESKKRG